MGYRRLYIFVEGNDDERFFRQILVPRLKDGYEQVDILKYSQKKNEWRVKFLKSVDSGDYADYIYVADINSSPCITKKKQSIVNKLKKFEPDAGRVVVVVKEIESWYLAGLTNKRRKALGIGKTSPGTNNITKEDFNNLRSKRFNSRSDFMLEILKHFRLDEAVKNNKSFEHFVKTFVKE